MKCKKTEQCGLENFELSSLAMFIRRLTNIQFKLIIPVLLLKKSAEKATPWGFSCGLREEVVPEKKNV